MTVSDPAPTTPPSLSDIYPLIDTHTHFDASVFDDDRNRQAQYAYEQGVRHLVLVGYVYRHVERMYHTKQMLDKLTCDTEDKQNEQSSVHTHIALGLHPFYIEQHTEQHLAHINERITTRRPLAIGEIGLDTYTDAMKAPEVFAKQQRFFKKQLDMAVTHKLPVMLHIRKSHAEALAILKEHDYDAHHLGGIAHSFSGGEQEAKAFVKLGFRLGVTGQVTNPNAKKLRRAICAAVDHYGIDCLVIETDCPDMQPLMGHASSHHSSHAGHSPDDEGEDTAESQRNVPANLPWVLASLSELLDVAPDKLAKQLWQNSCDALQMNWDYPI